MAHSGDGTTLAATWAIQRQVISALVLRDLHTRFGRENIGYLWLFLEPALLGGALATLHQVMGHGLPGGANVFIFWIVGYVPFYMVRSVVNRAPTTIEHNRPLLYHSRITLFDLSLSRSLLDFASAAGAVVVFTLLFGAVTGEWPQDPGRIVAGMVLLLLLAHGFGMLLTAGSVYTELLDRVIHIFTYLTMPLTGAFAMVFWLPHDLQQAMLTIPTVHCFELIRDGQFGGLLPTHYDIGYVLAWACGLNLLGMLALRHARRDVEV